MGEFGRREFLAASGQLAVLGRLRAGESGKSRVGLVTSTNKQLRRPSSVEDPLDYERVRDMVWLAIEYGRPHGGGLEAKIQPGAWVVIKPNLVSLLTRGSYRTGDVTDLRVIRAVTEYVARNSRASRITVAEGGSYRGSRDPLTDTVLHQYGRRIDALSCNWEREFAGMEQATLGGVLKDLAAQFPGRRIDYVDLGYDVMRDRAGEFRRVEVPKTPRGVGAFGRRPDYWISNTIAQCDFLISVPVAKVHAQSGITCCFKNYVGTAPRVAYAAPKSFSNGRLHSDYSVDDRIDGFIVDLAAFHPPDYNVVDGIRGLQYSEHNIDRADQTVRNNFILAGEDTVAVDALAADLLGYNSWDMEFLHMASQRDLGTMDLRQMNVLGEDPDRIRKMWAKAKPWHGRCNREWRVSRDPDSQLETWGRCVIPTDTLRFEKWAGGESAPGATYGAAARIQADGNRKAFLWVGAQGRVTATLNGERVMEDEAVTRYRVGQFQAPVQLRPGENRLVFRVKGLGKPPQLSVLMAGPRNDGNTVEGIRWLA